MNNGQVINIPCLCGHLGYDHVSPGIKNKCLIWNGTLCRPCDCPEYRRDNLAYLEKLSER